MAACSITRDGTAPNQSAPPGLSSGIEMQYIDRSVRPQDDPYRYLNGKWLDDFEIPADKATYVAFTMVDDRTQEQLHEIVSGLAATATRDSAAGDADVDAKKLADLYASFMDEERLEALGLGPLKPAFSAIDAIDSKKEISALIARFNRNGIGAPYSCNIAPDSKDSSKYAVSFQQSGLGLPDRDYYLKDDAKLKDARAKYLAHIERMLHMAGDLDARHSALDIVKLETAMAEVQWTRVANRDPLKTYNKVAVVDLKKLMPDFDWPLYLTEGRIAGMVDYVIVAQPSYLEGLDELITHTPLATWKSYFKWHVLSAAAPYLSKAFVEERFAFSGTVLRGIPENLPRWKRGLELLDDLMGEALGKLYVERYFPPPNKERMEVLVRNLLEAYTRDIDTLDWMSAETKRGAHAKLAKLATKIGYPNTWRDYGALSITPDDLWGNVVRATQFEYQRNIEKLGRPVDRNEWLMTPQTVNAYYSALMNEIVFPAAILQPPFFNAEADDAVNYGAIGAVIGHEISHGFDDRGSQYDADGNLRDWFTREDHEKFAAKTKAMVAQYDSYQPIPGFHVNGELTLGENIADNSGLSIAYQAYHLSLGSRAAPMIDGLSGDQRFFLGWTQVWRGKVREAEAIRRIKTDPHSPPAVRGRAPLVNQPGFYAAFGVKEGDNMYEPPQQRINIW
jgi:predicted metalloendopeptidase